MNWFNPDPNVWLNPFLSALLAAQRALGRAARACGLAGDSHGQPAWPWAQRIATETLQIDPGTARDLAQAFGLTGVALLCVMLALACAFARMVIARRHTRQDGARHTHRQAREASNTSKTGQTSHEHRPGHRARRILRRTSLALLVIATACAWLAPWPDTSLWLTDAVPTSFQETPFTVASIARGAPLYAQHCAACHGLDGRGSGPLAATLARWPPTVVGPLLGRRLDGELFWRTLNGMRDLHGAPTMPGFADKLTDADVWAILDYMKVLAAGGSAQSGVGWPVPVALPALDVQCANRAPQTLAAWRGNQRVRIVALDVSGAPGTRGATDVRATPPFEDPRWQTLLLVPDAALRPPLTTVTARATGNARPDRRYGNSAASADSANFADPATPAASLSPVAFPPFATSRAKVSLASLNNFSTLAPIQAKTVYKEMSNRCNGLNRKCASAIQTSDTRRTPQTIDAYRAAIDDYATSSQTIQVVQVINGRHASGASHDYRAAQPATRPRWLTRADQAAWADAGRASCVAATHGAWNAFAGIAGLAPQHFAGAQLLADRDGWLRAESKPGDASWANATLLCTAAGTGTAGAGNDNDQGNPDNSQNDHENSNESSNPGESGQPATAKPTAKSGTEKPGLDPLTALLLKIDAEPVRYVKGGFVH